MPEKRRRPLDGSTVPSRLAHGARKLPEPEAPRLNDLSDPEAGPPEEPGVPIASTELATQFLRDATDQYNFESELRPEEDHEPSGAPVGQLLSDATLESADQADFELPVSGSLADDQPETLGEPDELAINLRSGAIVEASLFDHPVPEVPEDEEERAAEDDFSVTYSAPLRAPVVVTDDPSDVDDDRQREIQRLWDERVKKRLHVAVLPHEREDENTPGK